MKHIVLLYTVLHSEFWCQCLATNCKRHNIFNLDMFLLTSRSGKDSPVDAQSIGYVLQNSLILSLKQETSLQNSNIFNRESVFLGVANRSRQWLQTRFFLLIELSLLSLKVEDVLSTEQRSIVIYNNHTRLRILCPCTDQLFVIPLA